MQSKYSNIFNAYSHTRMRTYGESTSGVTIHTEGGHRIDAKNMIMATNVPLSKQLIHQYYFLHKTNTTFRHH